MEKDNDIPEDKMNETIQDNKTNNKKTNNKTLSPAEVEKSLESEIDFEKISVVSDVEKETLPKEEIEKAEVEKEKEIPKNKFDKESWTPKTTIGKQVKDGSIKDVDYILNNGLTILEPEIVEILIPDIEHDLLLIGQSKGKFGGGQRRVFRQTQKKTQEGNKPKFATYAIVGNRNGYFGLGYGKAKETVPAREKAIRKAKLNIQKITRGCGSWECNCGNPHTIPFAVEGRCGSVIVKLLPAPKGTGLCIEKECAKILALAGVKDVWSRTFGKTKTKINHIKAFLNAMNNLMKARITAKQKKDMNIVDGKLSTSDTKDEFMDILEEAEAKVNNNTNTT
ncbi:MAG: 30S ribosomal protein S5 [Candidatus Woesearchaeota archaeon]